MDLLSLEKWDIKQNFYAFIVVIFIIIAIAAAFRRRHFNPYGYY